MFFASQSSIIVPSISVLTLSLVLLTRNDPAYITDYDEWSENKKTALSCYPVPLFRCLFLSGSQSAVSKCDSKQLLIVLT